METITKRGRQIANPTAKEFKAAFVATFSTECHLRLSEYVSIENSLETGHNGLNAVERLDQKNKLSRKAKEDYYIIRKMINRLHWEGVYSFKNPLRDLMRKAEQDCCTDFWRILNIIANA